MAAGMTRANRQYIFAFSCTHFLILLPIQSRVQSLLASSKSLEDSVAFVASVSVRFWSKERGTSLARLKPRTPFLGLCLLFAPKPNGNACDARYEDSGATLLLTPLQMPVFDTRKKHKPQFCTCSMNIFNVFIFDLKERYKIVFPKLYH